tara:strand:+ start:3316 stop:6852 length:3537 start_codon:yes stop_codon:yes gene_type:complete
MSGLMNKQEDKELLNVMEASNDTFTQEELSDLGAYVSPEYDTTTSQGVQTDDTVTPVDTDIPVAYSEDSFTPEELNDLLGIGNVGALPEEETPIYLDEYEDNQVFTKEFFATPNAQASINTFMVDRYGPREGGKREDETAGDYSERFFNKIRWMENNLASTGMGISWLHNADKDQKANFANLYAAYTDMPSFLESGGGESWNAITDTIFAAVLDPTNVVTMGASLGLKLVGGRMAARTVITSALRQNAGKVGASVAAEGLIGAMQEGANQSLRVEADMRSERDWTNIMYAGLLGGGLGGILNTGALAWGARDRSYADKLKERVLASGVPDGTGAKLADADSAANESIKNQLEGTDLEGLDGTPNIFDVAYARGVMDDHIEPTGVASGKITNETQKEAQAVVLELMAAVPHFQKKDNETISAAMVRALDAMSQGVETHDYSRVASLITDAGMDMGKFLNATETLEKVLKDSGVNAKDFAEMFGLSVHETAGFLGRQGALARAQNKLMRLAPEVMDFLEPAKAADIENATYFQGIWPAFKEGASKLDRIRRAILTSQPVTSMRNALSATTYVTFDMAADFLVNAADGIGKSLKAVAEGRGSVSGTYQGTKDVFTDSFGLLGRMADTGVTREVTEALLEQYPKLHNILLRTTQEAGQHTLPKRVLQLNALNIAQDQFIRSAVFVNSIERQLKDSGTDMMSILASKKPVPVSVVKKAVDDALQATFADVPQGGLSATFIKFVEKFPFVPVIGTAAFPFARFMASALSFQFKYSPASAIGGISRYNTARVMKKNGVKGADTLNKQAKKELAQSAIGTSAIMAATYYRSQHRDIPMGEIRVSETHTQDIAAFYPLPFYLAMGELVYQGYKAMGGDGPLAQSLDNTSGPDENKIDWKAAIQGLTGAQVRPSQVDSYLTTITDALNESGMGMEGGVSEEKFAAKSGKFIGELFGHYTTPVRTVRDILGAFDQDHNIVRDPNQLISDNKFMEAASNQVIKNMPFAAASLPAKTRATGDGTRGIMYRESPYIMQMTGAKNIAERTFVEKELIKRGFPLWSIGPKTGDKEYNSRISFHMRKYMNEIMKPYLRSSEYRNTKYAVDKTDKINEKLKEIRELAVEDAEPDMYTIAKVRGYNPINKAKWNKLPVSKRQSINLEFMDANDGKTIDGTNSYEQGLDMYSDRNKKK